MKSLKNISNWMNKAIMLKEYNGFKTGDYVLNHNGSAILFIKDLNHNGLIYEFIGYVKDGYVTLENNLMGNAIHSLNVLEYVTILPEELKSKVLKLMIFQ